MITPAELIADLDAALEEGGNTVTLRRLTLGPGGTQIPFDAEGLPASVRPLKPEELVGGIDQTWSKVVLSPTGINAAQWPLPIRKGDKIVETSGKIRNIEFPGHISVQDVLVRIELMVGG